MADDPTAAADSQPPRTTGGNFRWEPPTPAELQAMMPGYTIEKLLGRGGMGAVYKGIQTNLERTVAIKILPPGVEQEDPSFAERFKNEAKLMAKLMHPAVVGVFDFGTTSGGQLYIAMEYVDGTDVARMIASQKKLPPDHALAITAHVCDALSAAHKLGIVHRDIKPANILINMEGAVKVADFGLAKIEEPGTHGLTKTGYAMGTPDFVAPEALTLGTAIDGRADLYAVGVMLYQMLTGNIPRGAFKPASVLVPGLDPRYDPIILKAMQHDREERHQSSAELRRDLDVILTVPLVQQNAPAAAAVPAAQVAQVPAQRSAAQKPVAKGPSSPAGPPGKPAAVGKQQPESKKQKSAAGLYIGIAATVAVLGVLAFLFSGKKPAAETNTAATADASAKPASPIKVAGTPKPPVITTPAPKPVATASPTASARAPATPSTVKWHDMLAEWRKVGLFVPPFWKDEGGRVEALLGNTGGTPPPARVVSPDQALRITCTAPAKGTQKVGLRGTPSLGTQRGSNYEFGINPAGDFYLLISLGGKLESIKSWPTPPGFNPIALQTWEFRAVGDTLSAHLDGKLIGSATDGRLKEGFPAFFGRDQGTVITALEYASLGTVSATWRDWVAETRRGVGFKPPIFEDDGKEVRWSKYGVFGVLRLAQDAAVRVTWIPTPNDAALTLRGLDKFEGVSIRVPSDGTLAIHHWNANRSGQNKLLKSFAFPAGIDPKAEHTLEVRLIGSVLSAWVNGQSVGSVDNVPVWEGSTVIYGHPGTTMKKLEYAVLDGVSAIPPPPTGTTPAPAAAVQAGEQWVDVLPELLSKPLPSGFQKDGSGIRAMKLGALPFAPTQLTDVAVRVTARAKSPTPRWGINLRIGANQDNRYNANLYGGHGQLSRYNKDSQTVNLVGFGVPAGFSVEDLHTMEFRARGDKLTVLLDGKEVATAQDGTHPSGIIAVVGEVGTVFTKLEYRELPPSVAESAMRAASAPTKTPPPTPASVTPAEPKAAASTPMPPSGDSKPAAPADPVAIRLAEIEKQFLAAYAQQAGATHKAAVADLNVKFTAALDRSITTASQAGKLDEALALRNEKTLIQTSGSVPDADAADTSATLKALRKTYRDTMTMLIATRDKNAAPLHAAHDKALASYQDELTKAQKLDEAARVKAVRDQLSSGSRQTSDGASKPIAPPPAATAVTAPANNAPLTAATKDKPFTNSLGMKFVPVKDTAVLFCIHETRRQDYAAYAAEVPGVNNAWKDQQERGVPVGGGDDHPVVAVSWEDAQAFCVWLSKKEGRPYRLPTDREWSVAVGIGREEKMLKETTPELLHDKVPKEYPWGDQWPPPKGAGNYWDQTYQETFPIRQGIKDYTDGYATTAPVMSFKPNKFGLYDMGGNVWEHVEDWINDLQKNRVIRGSTWTQSSGIVSVLSSVRGGGPPDNRWYGNGFRIVVVVPTP